MERKAIRGIMLIVLLIGMLTFVFNVQPVKASETIYIRADGSIDPPTANITSVDNVTYTFTGNIYDSIVIERNNIVVDGAGYTLQGTGSGRGIALAGKSNVTIKNMEIKAFRFGIYLNMSSNNCISGNNIKNNGRGIELEWFSNYNSICDNNITNNQWWGGIYLHDSSNNSISGNSIEANKYYGIWLERSSNNTLRNNKATNNRYNFGIYGLSLPHYIHDIDTSNTVDGKPVYYWVNRQHMVVPPNAGYVALINCTYITVRNLNLTNNQHVLLAFTTNSLITKNNIKNNEWGISLWESSNNTISRNNITMEWNYGWISWSGISLFSSSNNSISENSITNTLWRSIWFWNSSKNSIFENNITNNWGGIKLDLSSNNIFRSNSMTNNKYNFEVSGTSLTDFVNDVDVSNTIDGKPIYYWINERDKAVPLDTGYVALINCTRITVQNLNLTNNGQGLLLALTTNSTITKNNITNNWDGICLISSSSNSIYGNNLTNNYNGIWFWNSSSNSIFGNNVTNNWWRGISLYSSSNNSIYHNNFIDNKNQVYIYNSVNVWDDGYPSGGNYWTDYVGVDVKSGLGQDMHGSDGIGDSPYVIDSNNTDRYPLMYPYGTPPPPTYSLTITTTVDGTTDPQPSIYNYIVGTSVNITAIPDIGFSFGYWLLDGEVRTENPITVVIDANHTLQAFFIDNILPEIGNPTQEPPPDNVQPYQNVTVTVNVTDYGTGIRNVTLWYSLDNGKTWITKNMTEICTDTYQATIPGYENCTWVTYKIVAYDNAGNNATKDNNGYNYKYHVIPEFPSAMTLPLFMFLTILAVVFAKRRFPRKPRN